MALSARETRSKITINTNVTRRKIQTLSVREKQSLALVLQLVEDAKVSSNQGGIAYVFGGIAYVFGGIAYTFERLIP